MKLDEYTKHDGLALAALVRAGEVSEAELARLALSALDRVNPQLNAIAGTFEPPRIGSTREDARFHGVPTFLKDLGAGIAGCRQEMGSLLCKGFIPATTSHFAQAILNAGFQILGRTTCPEFGLTLTTESNATGATANPWHPACIAGGSSGGSAALVAAGVVPVAHSNDGGGSTRIPASICGNVGLKTSRGRVSLGPNNSDIASPLIAEGCNSRTVRDTAAFLDSVCKPQRGEATIAGHDPKGFLTRLEAPPHRFRIAVSIEPWGPEPIDSAIRAEVMRIAGRLRELGHIVEEATPGIVRDGQALAAFKALWFAGAHGIVTAMAPAVQQQPGPEMLESLTLQMVERGQSITATEYAGALGHANLVARELAGFFSEWDLLLTPTLAKPTPRLGSELTMSSGLDVDAWFEQAMGFVPHTPIANFTGLPAISVPCGSGPGNLPLGMHFFGPMASESWLLDIARQLEEAEPWQSRRPQIHAAA